MPIAVTRQTRATLAATAADRWRAAYLGKPLNYTLLDGRRPAEVHALLVALGEAAEPDTINAAIGNGWWTATSKCDGCSSEDGQDRFEAYSFGHERRSVFLCEPCLRDFIETALVALPVGR